MQKTWNLQESFLARLSDIKAAEFNTHRSPSFQGSEILQATPVFIRYLGTSVLMLWDFPAPPVLLPPLGIWGANVPGTNRAEALTPPKSIILGLTEFTSITRSTGQLATRARHMYVWLPVD